MRDLIFSILIVIVALLLYRKWESFTSGSKPKQVVPPNEANLYFFYTDWCGWSQKAQPVMKKVEETLSTPGGKFGNTAVKFVRVDAEEDREKAEMYEVKAYPTILLETSEYIRPFNKGVTYENVVAFLREALGEESLDAALPAVE